MRIVKSSPYGELKYHNVIKKDKDFQNDVMYYEKKNKDFANEAEDIFHALYEEDIEFKGDGRVKTLIDTIKETADFKSLKDRTKYHPVQAYISMKEMIPELEQIMKDIPKDEKNNPLDAKQKDNIRRAVRVAIKNGASKVDRDEEMFELLGIGKGMGIESEQDISDALEVSKRIGNDEEFQKIIAMAGRMERNAENTIKTNVARGEQELIGITMSDRYQQALPCEFRHRDLFNMKYIEGKLQTRLYRDKQPEDQGPIIVCIDESGSMQGFPYHFSRSLLFGIYVVACTQNRPMIVNRFSGNVITHEIKCPADILGLMNKFMNGGTDFNKALNTSFEQIKSNPEFKKADIIFITDGMDYLNEEVTKEIQTIKESISMKIIGLMIGYSTLTLESFCDKVFACHDEESSSSFCEEVFSL